MKKNIKLELKGGYLVTISIASESILAKVQTPDRLKFWKGIIKDISLKASFFLEVSPYFISRMLFVNEKTMELCIMKGLLGSGCFPSKKNLIEVKPNSLYWERSLFWKNPPEDLVFLEKYHESSYNGDILSYSKGKIRNTKNCYIRTFTSSVENVKKLAFRELQIIKELKVFGIRVNILGYYFINNAPLSSYVLVSELFPATLTRMIDKSIDEKIIALSNLIKLVYRLNSLGIYYFLLNPATIFVDAEDLILGDYFLAVHNNGEEIEEVLHYFLISKSRFFPLDHPCLDFNPKNCSRGTNYDLECTDFDSLIKIVSYLFSNELGSLPIIKIKNKSQILLNYDTIKGCLLFKQTLNLKLVDIICRIIIGEIDLKTLNSCFNLNEISCFCMNTSEHSVISSNEFHEILERFQTKLQYKILDYRQKKQLFFEYLLNESEEFLEVKKLTFTKSRESFLNTPCFSNYLPVSDGIVYFIWVFLTDMNQSELQRERFYTAIVSNQILSVIDYKRKLESIQFLSPFLQDYLIILLTVQNYQSEWTELFKKNGFFINLSLCFCLRYHKKVYDILKNLITHQKILNILAHFLDPVQNSQIKEIIVDNALPNVYIIPLCSNLHGITTYNLNIFLNIYDVITIDDAAPRYIAAWFVTLLHELAHFMRRFTSKNFLESRSRITVRNESSIETLDSFINLTENIIEEKNIRGEAGLEAENAFWEPQLYINDLSGEIILSGEFDSKDFLNSIKKENLKKNSPRLGISKGRLPLLFLNDKYCGLSRR